MRISKHWLADYVELSDMSAEEFSELITTRVAEVDELEVVASPMEWACVAEILAIKPHPERDKLSIVTVGVGAEQVELVCGASNCRVGMRTAYLPPGAKRVVPGVQRETSEALQDVSVVEIAGVSSAGVLVSEAELGLSSDHEGIIDLDILGEGENGLSLAPGDLLSQVWGGPDIVLEIDNKSLTHRPDLWCHFGFARELSAILDLPLLKDVDAFSDNTEAGHALGLELGGSVEKKSPWKVSIDSESGCRRFMAIQIDGIKNTVAPLWMRRRLFSVGAGIRNVLVDLSNYVMHDIGQPNHVYDTSLLRGNEINVRKATKGETFAGLDGETYELDSSDIVIADAEVAVALGGVLGGEDTAVSSETQSVLLESANFEPVTVRQTCKTKHLRTDASNRFEKSLSAFSTPLAVHRFIELLTEIQPEINVPYGFSEDFLERPATIEVPLRYDYIRKRLGNEISNSEIHRILISLGFVETDDSSLVVPYYRATRDIDTEEDLVEEVGRIYGYENIPEQAPKIESVAGHHRPLGKVEEGARALLSSLGFSEIYQYSFMSSERAVELGYPESRMIEVKNPVDTNLDVIRTTLIPGVLKAARGNTRYFDSLSFFELGRTYESLESELHESLAHRESIKNPAGLERHLLSFAYSSGRSESEAGSLCTPTVDQGSDWYAAAEVVRRLVWRITRREAEYSSYAESPTSYSPSDDSQPEWFAEKMPWMHPARCAQIIVDGILCGLIAEVHPRYADIDDSKRLVLVELDLDLLVSASAELAQFKPLPKYPDSLFEISIVTPVDCEYREVREIIETSVESSFLRSIEAVSVYTGAPLADTEKSISVKLAFGSEERTLSPEELKSLQDAVMQGISDSPYSLRS